MNEENESEEISDRPSESEIISGTETLEPSPESLTEETSLDSSEKSASIQKYEEEWTILSRGDDPEFEELRRKAVLGYLRTSRFRSFCWRIFLGIFPLNSNDWLPHIRGQREKYKRLISEFSFEPWERSEPGDNPLSQSAESIWHQHFCDKELKAVIRQDVVRTFPGIDFFRKDLIQNAMVNILFCYARENPAMCYRQGMHEILAPLLFVLHCDQQALLHAKEYVSVGEDILEILDNQYLEEDGYAIFSRIMSGLETSYRVNDIVPTSTGYFPASLSPTSPQHCENEVIAQLNWIRDNLLAPKDPDLHAHLKSLDIPLSLFGIRWLRLLFGREFPLQDLLVLWDAIFAVGPNFELVDYIVVAMLIAIRYQLLNSDYTTCLTYLMRYPGALDISYIIELSLYLKDPSKYCEPAIPTHHKTGAQLINSPVNKLKKKLPIKEKQKIETGAFGKLKKFSTKSRWNSSRISDRGESESNIIVGYTLDDPKLIQVELDHAHSIMELCRVKLRQYHHILQHTFCEGKPPEVQQALEGIYELCALLKTRHQSIPQAEVEPAYEAGEIRPDRSRAIPPPNKLALKKMPKDVVKPTPKGPSSVQLEIIKGPTEGLEGEKIIGAPVQDPLGVLKSPLLEQSLSLKFNAFALKE